MNRISLFAAGLLASGGVFAAPVDLSTLTAAVDLTTVISGVVAVGALLMAPSVAKYAVGSIRRMFPK